MLYHVSTKMLFHYQLFKCTTQTSASCRSADLYIIKMNHKIKAIADRCRHHISNCFDWHVTTITIVSPSLLSLLLFSLLLFSVFVFGVHPFWPQLPFAYLIRLLWGFDSISSCHCNRPVVEIIIIAARLDCQPPMMKLHGGNKSRIQTCRCWRWKLLVMWRCL